MDDVAAARATRAASRIGQVLKEKWRLDQVLGVGGMAVVYAATHRNGKRVAIKMLHAEYSVDPEVRARFRREGYLVNQVEHPGVIGVLDDDTTDDGAVFLVMDLLEGESVEARRLRKGGTLEAGEVLSIADQVLGVLEVAHKKDLVHRDLKPENLFLCRDGQVKLLDFGIARLRELSNKIGATMNDNTTMGTPAFMPPEQARGQWSAVDPRTDLWALGASMFTLLSGRIVHESKSVSDVLVAAMTKPAPPVTAKAPGVDASIAALVDRALAFDPNERWPDARSMQEAVRQAYHQVMGSPVSTAPRLGVSAVLGPPLGGVPTAEPGTGAGAPAESKPEPPTPKRGSGPPGATSAILAEESSQDHGAPASRAVRQEVVGADALPFQREVGAAPQGPPLYAARAGGALPAPFPFHGGVAQGPRAPSPNPSMGAWAPDPVAVRYAGGVVARPVSPERRTGSISRSRFLLLGAGLALAVGLGLALMVAVGAFAGPRPRPSASPASAIAVPESQPAASPDPPAAPAPPSGSTAPDPRSNAEATPAPTAATARARATSGSAPAPPPRNPLDRRR
jgi:eukaryotic-like serine/threonine-protein kinase